SAKRATSYPLMGGIGSTERLNSGRSPLSASSGRDLNKAAMNCSRVPTEVVKYYNQFLKLKAV
ncbi:hypothetical protein L9F63_008884, partial [Diploptera punctata]